MKSSALVRLLCVSNLVLPLLKKANSVMAQCKCISFFFFLIDLVLLDSLQPLIKSADPTVVCGYG